MIRPALGQTRLYCFFYLFVCFNRLLNTVQHGSLTFSGRLQTEVQSYWNPSIHSYIHPFFILSSHPYICPFPPTSTSTSLHHPSVHSSRHPSTYSGCLRPVILDDNLNQDTEISVSAKSENQVDLNISEAPLGLPSPRLGEDRLHPTSV